MKKYEEMTQDLLNDENLIQFLENQARQGWMIKSMNYSYMTFEECKPKNLKFQVDYVEVSDDYNKILKEQGYEYICELKGKNIYCNEDREADDLYNDDTTKIMSYLNYYKLSKILYKILWIFFISMQLYIAYDDMIYVFYNHLFVRVLTHTSEYIFMGIILLWVLYLIVDTVYLIYMRKHYKKMSHNKETKPLNIKLLRAHECIENIHSIFGLSLLPFCVLSIMDKYDWVRICLILTLTLFIILLNLYIFRRHERRSVIYVAGTLISLCLCFGLYQYTNIKVPVNKLYYEDKVSEAYIDANDDLLSSYRMSHVFHNDYYERCVVSVNETFAKEIFKEEVVLLECYSRKAVGKSDFKEYKEAIQSMKVIEDERIDEGYYNFEYAILRKDNMVISFKIRDVFKEEVFDYYLR